MPVDIKEHTYRDLRIAIPVGDVEASAIIGAYGTEPLFDIQISGETGAVTINLLYKNVKV